VAYTFYRWFRTELAARLGSLPATTSATQPRRAKLAVGVDVSGSGLPNQVANVALDVLGPGDVTGIDGRQVIRMYPLPGTLDFEHSYHAHVELDRPDLPWLFTPFGADSQNALRPWICLVVVKRGDSVTLDPTLPPTLSVKPPEVVALPDLDHVAAWVHLQVTGDTSSGLDAITVNEPERILARLICPRELEAGTAYYACVVPTFKLGALAGLGRNVPANVKLDDLAWTSGDQLVELPVYHHWEFSTGGVGDFQSLVLRLQPQTDLPGVGERSLDVASPGFGLAPRTPPATVQLGGVFLVEDPTPSPVDQKFAADLEPVLNATGTVGPPIYGRWHAAVTRVDAATPTGWVEELNVDPRHRVAAGLGTQVVQERQEDLMAAIWEQLGEILRANQLLRQAQLAVAASERVVGRHIRPLGNVALLELAGPALARIRVGPGKTARKAVAESCLPLLAVSGAFRRIARVHGPLERRLGPLQGVSFPDLRPKPALEAGSVVTALAAGSLRAQPVQLPSGAVPLPPTTPGRPPILFPVRPPDGDGPEPGPLRELAGTFTKLASRAATSACTPLDVNALAATARAALEPDVAVAGRARALISVPQRGRVRLSARLDPVMAAPEIPTPMIGPLLELGQDWLLPGLAEVPPNTIAIVEPNSAFIEAYMIGLNHELGRELLWRGFPTDQRGTVFARFWDRRGSVSTRTAPVPDRDIPPIHEWRDQNLKPTALGTNLDHGAKDLVVLLIRGDLLQRYPRTNIYAQRARWQRDPRGGDIVFADDRALREPVPLPDARGWEQDARFPVFRGQPLGDVTFLGFPLRKEDVRGLDPKKATARTSDAEAGWYVVFEEQPTEPRFGGTPAAAARSEDVARTLLKNAFRLFVHGRDLVQG
jgi:hypothetical protein